MDMTLRITASCVAAIVLLSGSFAGQAEDTLLPARADRTDRSFAAVRGKIATLRHEISLLNLINGLYLTDEQVAELIRIAREAQGYRAMCRDKLGALAGGTVEAFGQLRHEAMFGNGLAKDTERRASALNRDARDVREHLSKQLLLLEKRVKGVMTASQLQVIDEFKRCLIPPKNLKDPSRVGQANDGSRGETVLNRMRLMPKRRYNAARRSLAARFVERTMKYSARLTPEERSNLIDRTVAIFDRARSMSDEEFALARAELGEKLIEPKTRIDKERSRLAKLARSQYSLGKVGRHFLDPSVVGLLEERQRLAREYRQPEERRFEQIPAAEVFSSKAPVRIEVGGEVRVTGRWQK